MISPQSPCSLESLAAQLMLMDTSGADSTLGSSYVLCRSQTEPTTPNRTTRVFCQVQVSYTSCHIKPAAKRLCTSHYYSGHKLGFPGGTTPTHHCMARNIAGSWRCVKMQD